MTAATILDKLDGLCSDAKYGGDSIQPYQIEELLTEAWEQGYGAGRDDEAEGRSHRDPHRSPNPYKPVRQ